MVRKKKEITPEEQLKIDMQLETDLARLQRQYRNLERDRGAYSSGAKMAKQKKLLQILTKEQNDVLTDLFVATCSTKKTQDAHVTANLFSLLGEHDEFEAKIVEKKAHLREIDDQIVMVKKRVIEIRTKLPGETDQARRVLEGQKSLEGLENKLDTAVKRFCSVQTENRHLRQEIEHLFIERETFNKLWENLIANLNKGKKFMVDLIEQATIAYNERDECVARLQALRSKAHSDLIMDTQEMLLLQRRMDHDSKLQEFLAIKGQKRNMQHLEDKLMAKKRQKREEMQKHLVTCKEILSRIVDFTELASVEEIFANYIAQEEENFSNFNYINNINKDIEGLTDGLVDLHQKIDFEKKLRDERALHQENNIKKYNKELEDMTKQADDTQQQLDATNTVLRSLYGGIDKLFKICKCSNAPFLELLGDNAAINDYNVLLYLSMLESRVTDLILSQYYSEKALRKKDRPSTYIDEDVYAIPVRVVEDFAPTNPCPLCVDQELVSDLIDTLQFVQSKEEVVEKLKFRLSLPGGLERLHNVSACHLPKSRQIIQRRYQ